MSVEASDNILCKVEISNTNTNHKEETKGEESIERGACPIMSKRTRDCCVSPVRVGNKLLDRKPSGESISNTKTLKQFRQSSDGSAFENTKNAIMRCPVFSNTEMSIPKSVSCPFLVRLGEQSLGENNEHLKETEKEVADSGKVQKEKKNDQANDVCLTTSTSGDVVERDVCQESSTTYAAKDIECLTKPGDTLDTLSPDDYFKIILKWKFGVDTQVKQALSLPPEFFPSPTREQIDGYTTEMINIVRDNRVDLLKEKLESKAVPSLQLSNRFGESLIHLACRRGNKEAVDYLLGEAGVSVRCRDDVGRTPFHDCCWNPNPQMEIFGQLLKQDSILLLASDKRNFTPFSYARREHWLQWKEFLYNHVDFINPDEDIVRSLFSLEK